MERYSSSINFASITDTNDQNPQEMIFDACNHSKIPDAIFPEIAKFGTFQSFADGSRIIQPRNALVKKFNNPSRIVRPQFVQFTFGRP